MIPASLSFHSYSAQLSLITSLLLPFAASQAPAPSSTQPSFIEQPISHPAREDVLTPGSIFKIEWTPDKHFENVTLELWDKTSWGYSRDFGELCYHWVNPFCGTIASRTPNTGSFEWQVPKPGSDFPRGERVFWIKMYVDDFFKPEIGNKDPILSYSQNFMFAPENGEVPPPPPPEDLPTGTPAGPEITQQPQPGTVYITVHDGASESVIPMATTSSIAANTTGTTTTSKTIPTESEGGASSWTRTFPFALAVLVGLL